VETEPPQRRIVRCDRCGRSFICEPEEVLRYIRDGWPRCHGEEMRYFTEVDRPGRQPPPGVK